MNRTVPISVITPTHNRRCSLSRAIRSVQEQTFTDYEHLIIDDASSDGTEELVASFGDSRIRYLRLERWSGANVARNTGIAQARAPWLSFLDSDDTYLPQRLERIAQRIDTGPAAPLFISSFTTVKRDQNRLAINPDRILSGVDLQRALMLHCVCIAGSGITVRKDAIVESGGFHPLLMRLQDREALLRLATRCQAQLLGEVDWLKYVSPDSISAPRRGYVESLAALVEVYPELGERHRRLIGFQLARHLLKDLIGGRLGLLRESLRSNRDQPSLRFTVRQLLSDYRFGQHERKRFWQELQAC